MFEILESKFRWLGMDTTIWGPSPHHVEPEQLDAEDLGRLLEPDGQNRGPRVLSTALQILFPPGRIEIWVDAVLFDGFVLDLLLPLLAVPRKLVSSIADHKHWLGE